MPKRADPNSHRQPRLRERNEPHEEHGIPYADCDPAVASASKRTLDVAGHYGRPDIFHLEVKREVLAPIDFG